MKTGQLVFGLLVALAASGSWAAEPAAAAGIDGKWNATVDGGPGGPVELQFEFKADGEKLAGQLSMAMMPEPTSIAEGKIKGEEISFAISFTMMEGAPPLVISYTGKLKGDELAMKSVFDMGQGATETEFVAKRAK
jgi:hypothetical protein